MSEYPKILRLYPLNPNLLDPDDVIDEDVLQALKKARNEWGGNALIIDGPKRGRFYSLTPEDIRERKVLIIIVRRSLNYRFTPEIFNVSEEVIIYNILVDPETRTFFLSMHN